MKTIKRLGVCVFAVLPLACVSKAAVVTVGGFSQSAVVSAINAAGNNDTVFFPAGTYNMSSTIDILNGKVLTFDGVRARSILVNTDGGYTFFNVPSGDRFTNLVFRGGGLHFQYASINNNVVQYCFFDNPLPQIPINATGGAVGSLVDSNVMVYDLCTTACTGYYPLWFKSQWEFDQMSITNNYIAGSHEAINAQNNPDQPLGSNNHIDNNTILRTIRMAIEVSANMNNSTFNNNYIAQWESGDESQCIEGDTCPPYGNPKFGCANFQNGSPGNRIDCNSFGISIPMQNCNNMQFNNNRFYGTPAGPGDTALGATNWGMELICPGSGGSATGNVIKNFVNLIWDDEGTTSGGIPFKPKVHDNILCGPSFDYTRASAGDGWGPNNVYTASCAGVPTDPVPCAPFNPFTGASDNTYPPGCGSGVILPQPDFTITAAPASRTVVAGGSSSYTATVAGINGFSGTVALGASGFPGTTTSGYGFRRAITIDHTQVGAADLANFPVVVSGTFTYLKSVANGGKVQNGNCWDVTFTSDVGGSTQLPFDRAICNLTTGTVEFWINVAGISHTVDTTFYEFYGNASIAADPQQHAIAFGTDAVSNHHFQDGTTLTAFDTVRSATDTVTGTVTAGAGQIDGAAAFANGLVTAAIPQFSGALTVSAWVFPTATSADSTIVANNNGGVQNYAIWLTDTTHVELTGAGGIGVVAISPAWTLNAWNYIVWTLDGTNSKVYVNGTLANTTATTQVAGNAPGSLLIGRDNAVEPFPGRLDEVRIFSSAHTAGWVTAEYNNQKSASTFLATGAEVPLTGSVTTFAFAPATLAGAGTSTLNFTLPSDAITGTYTVVITGSSGGIVHTANTTLVVQAAPVHITNLSVSGVTNTQAILRWNVDTAPTGCSVAVSKSASYTPLAHDVDPVLFAGSNLVTRSGAIVLGTAVTFVAGQRVTQRALDGRRYSRALQAGTLYYARVTCGASQSATTFVTAQIPIGNTWLEQPMPDPGNPGEWLQPSVSFTDRTEELIDPHTGDLIKRVSLANDNTNRSPNETFTFGFGSGWTNPGNGTTVNGVFATIANSVAPLAITGVTGLWGNIHGPDFGQTRQDEYVPVMFQPSVSMKSSNAACTPGNVNPVCGVNICVTANGTTCAAQPVTAASLTTTVQVTNTLTAYQAGTGVDGDTLEVMPDRPFNQVEAATRSGTLTCDGSATATWASGDLFPGTWAAGSSIQISVVGLPVMFSISGYTNTRALVLASNCASGTWNFTGANFGLLVWRVAPNTDTISVDGATVNYVLGFHRAPPDYSGAFNMCSDATVVGSTGNPGYNCINDTVGGAQVFWIDSLTGESHIFAKLGGFVTASPFKPGAPDSWYVDVGGGNVQVRTYVGDHLEPAAGQTDTSGQAVFGLFNGDLFACNGTTHTTRCYNTLNLTTAGNTMGDLTAAFNPSYDKVKFAAWAFQQVESGILHWTAQTMAVGLGWNVVFDPAATTNGRPGNAGCLTNGNTGCVIATMPSWSSPGCRWCTIKAGTPLYVADWVQFTPYFDQTLTALGTGQGPFVVRTVGTIPDATTACPANSYGQTNNCVTITVDGEVYDFGEGTGSRGSYGNAAIGDQIQFPAVGTHYNSESMILLGKSGTSWTFARNYNGAGQIPGATLGSNAFIQFTCTNIYPGAADNSLRGKEEQWNFRNDTMGLNAGGVTVVNSANGVNAHYYNDYGTAAYSYSQDTRCTATFGCYQGQKITTTFPDLLSGITPITGLSTQGPVFQGVTAPYNNGGWQSHPWSAGGQATVTDQRFFFDGRPFLGFSGLTSTVTLVSGQLYKAPAGTTTLNRKFLPTLALAGPHPLIDVSSSSLSNGIIGSGDAISNASGDSWKYCVVLVANECVFGSIAGEVYFNIPKLTFPSCQYYGGTAQQIYEDIDVCIADASAMSNATVRIPLDRFDMTGREMQALTHGLSRPHYTDPFWHGHPLGNGRWIYNYTQNMDGYSSGEVVTAVPPVTLDSTNRTGFIPLNVGVPAGAANAVIEFGYAENGGNLLNCTSRNENCAVGGATNSGQIQATPFWFVTAETASLTGTPCSTGCNISVPVLPAHVVYWRIAFRDSSHNVLRRSAISATAVY